MEATSIPKRLKIEVDVQERKQKHSSRPSRERLGDILSRSRDPSWDMFLILALVLQWFREHQLFEKTRSQDAFWSDFDRFGRPRGSKKEAKRDPRGTKNDTQMTSKN